MRKNIKAIRNEEENENGDTTVQDNKREKQIAIACGLRRNRSRAGYDAHDEFENPYELKSTTKTGVTTARDVGLHTIKIWRNEYWIFAAGKQEKKNFKISSLYIAHPNDLEEAFNHIEDQIYARYIPSIRIIDLAKNYGASDEDIEICNYVINRGVTLNNPKIPIKLIKEKSTALIINSNKSIHNQIIDFVKAHPLDNIGNNIQ